jgi:hypothetical protein
MGLRYSVAMPGSLDGVRIADFSRAGGPYATMLLGDRAPRSPRSNARARATTLGSGAAADAAGDATYFLGSTATRRR